MENIVELLKEKLITLSTSVTPAEKVEAEAEVGLSKPTVDKYLAGDIRKIETATKLVQFFSKKVQERIEKIRETNLI